MDKLKRKFTPVVCLYCGVQRLTLNPEEECPYCGATKSRPVEKKLMPYGGRDPRRVQPI